ncbi:hypothetical protein EST38_g8643 [Candolleomyces aberdarensis]|uniref:Fe2OG dioxygenase domain-containing protein n=1 Tax=Candolleomyces aberdarensis TaxID=2316362 RepID=A0A4V1Q335_9AGAR|nr:hypothetical protein EST38_g8643 [Candolleomyces aberdarensis]
MNVDAYANEFQHGSAYSAPDTPAALDLHDDLDNALSGSFNFTGNYYFKETDPNAPNPGLRIGGIGTVGLPLSDRDAQSIISRASQAPFGKGNETIVDKTVRDTWEINARDVECTNPRWAQYVDRVASHTIWSALGAAPWSSNPRCQLYKLLLYHTGSHFLPHQDTYKDDGMFATVVFVLPSKFEGGEVHVSHDGRKAVIDVSEDSEFSTSILAWYTDVLHEIKPVTSGYRLTLSYNLCQTAPNLLRPSLPDMHGAGAAFRNVLAKWKAGAYMVAHSPPILAYILSHEYTPSDLRQGLDKLKGSDAHKVVHLLPIAKELGFSVCLGNFTFSQSGYAPGTDEELWEALPMDYITEEIYHVSNLVPVECAIPFMAELTRFDISKDCLVPKEPFESTPPSRSEYEGYHGNEPGTLELWYNRSVLIIFRPEDEIGVLVGIKGQASTGSRAIENYTYAFTSSWCKLEWIYEKFELCLTLGQLELCGALLSEMPAGGVDMPTMFKEIYMPLIPRLGDRLREDRKTITSAPFAGFFKELISLYLVHILGSKELLLPFDLRVGCYCRDCELLDVWVHDLSNQDPFRLEASHDRLSHLESRLDNDDEDPFKWEFEIDSIQPTIVVNKRQEPFLRFSWKARQKAARAFLDNIGGYYGLRDSELREIMGDSTKVTRGQADDPIALAASKSLFAPQRPTKVERIAHMVDLCFPVGELDPCATLLPNAFRYRSGGMTLLTMFKGVYTPLIPQLKVVLEQYGQRLPVIEPFASFVRELIS